MAAPAEALLDEAVTIDPGFASAWFQLSRVHSSAERRIHALEQAVALADLVSEGERLVIIAAQARMNRLPGQAGACLEKLVQLYPRDARAHNEYGNHLYSQKDWAGAIEQYLIAVELDPGFTEAYNGLGYAYRYQGNLRASESYFQKYIALLPNDPNPYDSYADLLASMNRHEEAIELYRRALAIDPGFEASHISIASNYNMLGRFAEARDELHHCLAELPPNGMRHSHLMAVAVAYVFEGELEQAAAHVEEAIQLARELRDFQTVSADLDRLGRIYLEAGRPDDAAKAFVQSLQLDQSDPEARSIRTGVNSQLDHQQRMALVWLTRGDFESASACALKYDEMVAQLDDVALVQLSQQTLGLIALGRGELDSAIASLSRSDLTHGYNQFYLAMAYERAGDMTQALRHYRNASAYDQFDPFGHAFVHRRAVDKVGLLAARLRTPRQPGPLNAGFSADMSLKTEPGH